MVEFRHILSNTTPRLLLYSLSVLHAHTVAIGVHREPCYPARLCLQDSGGWELLRGQVQLPDEAMYQCLLRKILLHNRCVMCEREKGRGGVGGCSSSNFIKCRQWGVLSQKNFQKINVSSNTKPALV